MWRRTLRLRERIELRSKASLVEIPSWLPRAAVHSGRRGSRVVPAAAGVNGMIPLGTCGTLPPLPSIGTLKPAPSLRRPELSASTLIPIRPAVFAQFHCPAPGYRDAPRHASGTYASATISYFADRLTAKAKSPDAAAAAVATAGALTVTTATPKRVSAQAGVDA